MFKNNARRKESATQCLRTGLIFLAIALSLGSAGQTTSAAAAPAIQEEDDMVTRLYLDVVKPDIFCVGDTRTIRVTPKKEITVPPLYGGDRHIYSRGIGGVNIKAEMVLTHDIATVEPSSRRSGGPSFIVGRGALGPREWEPGFGEVTFTIHALKAGTTFLVLTAQVPQRYSGGRTIFFGPRDSPPSIPIKVVNCKYKVQVYFSMYGLFSGTSGTAMGYMETTLTGDGEYYSGQGLLDVPQSRTMPGCAVSHSGFKSPTKIIGRLTDSQGTRTLKLEIKYEPGEYYGSMSCPYASGSGSGSEDPSSILRTSEVFPENGGSKSERIDIAGWLGTSTIVVMPVESK